MLLSALINHLHLRPEAIEHARHVFREDEFGSIVIDDFLQPPLAAGLLACFEGDGEFALHHSLKQSGPSEEPGYEEHSVSQACFEKSPESRWLARELLMQGHASGRADSEGWRAHMQLMELLSSTAFQAYLSAMTSVTELEDVTYMARTMRFGDLCVAHSDAGDGRNLCMLLYIGNEWKPAFGGRFQNVVNGEAARSTDPRGNRLILHRPDVRQIHSVEPINEAGHQWRRHTYSVWFGAFPTAD